MRVVTAAEIDRVLTFPALIEALAEAFRGDMVAPVRHHHEIERQGAHGTLLLMPAWTGPAMPDGFLGVKVVTGLSGERRQKPAERAGHLPAHGRRYGRSRSPCSTARA